MVLLPKPMRRAAQIALPLLAVIALTAAGGNEGRFQWLGHRMMCICGCGQILLECNHVGCQYSDHMRSELMGMLGRGDNDNSIMQEFAHKYSATVFAAPGNTGFNRAAWITPMLALLLGAVTVARIAREWKDRTAPDSAARDRGVVGKTEFEHFQQRAREETQL